LVNSKALFVTIYNEMAQKEGYRLITPDILESLRNMSIPERCRFLKVPMYKIPFLIIPFLKIYRKNIASLEFNDGIEEMLGVLLQKGIQYAVISTNSRKTIEEFFRLKN